MDLQRKTPEAPLDVDMTPLIDVTFLLLVFFMIVSVFNEMERTAELELPEAYQALIEKDVAKQRAIVNIEPDGQVVMFGRRVTIDQFKVQLGKHLVFLRKLGDTSGRAPIILRGDKDCRYEYVRDVIGAVYEAEITKVMFAAYQREEGGDEW